jgi:hypothetical protein
MPRTITVKMENFEREAHELGIYNLNDFYDSEAFKAKHSMVEKTIVCELS